MVTSCQEINIKLMIAGMPNVGKSSLVNALRQTYYNKGVTPLHGISMSLFFLSQTC